MAFVSSRNQDRGRRGYLVGVLRHQQSSKRMQVPLALGSARFLCVLGIRSGNRLRSGNAATDFKNTTTDATAASRADAGAMTCAHPTTRNRCRLLTQYNSRAERPAVPLPWFRGWGCGYRLCVPAEEPPLSVLR